MSLRRFVLWGFAAWGAIAVAAFAAAPRVVGAPGPSQSLMARVPGAALALIELEAGSGEATIGATAADAIEIHVDVRPGEIARWPFQQTSVGDPSTARLDTRVAGTALKVSLDGAGPLEARWTILAPAHLAARVTMDRGQVHLSGLEGGADISASAGLGSAPGLIDVDVPRGWLTLNLGVGTITAKTGSPSYGDVDVRSSVGDAALIVDRHEIVAPHEPGPGHRLRLAGEGADRLLVKVHVGTATLQIH